MIIKNIDLLLDDPKVAEDFLCQILFFRREEELLVNGNCRLRLMQRTNEERTIKEPQATYVGIEHLALEAADINIALNYCFDQKLVLETDHGKPFYNPNVWGTGLLYFNILTDFGVKIEISQRLDRPAQTAAPPIFGMEHLGVQVADMDKSLSYYLSLGFTQSYPTVEIITSDRILCSMIAAGDFTVELYEFTSSSNYKSFTNEPLAGLVLMNIPGRSDTLTGPNGEKFSAA